MIRTASGWANAWRTSALCGVLGVSAVSWAGAPGAAVSANATGVVAPAVVAVIANPPAAVPAVSVTCAVPSAPVVAVAASSARIWSRAEVRNIGEKPVTVRGEPRFWTGDYEGVLVSDSAATARQRWDEIEALDGQNGIVCIRDDWQSKRFVKIVNDFVRSHPAARFDRDQWRAHLRRGGPLWLQHAEAGDAPVSPIGRTGTA